jgi:hypothetical protein
VACHRRGVEPSAPDRRPADPRRRVLARRLIVAVVVVVQLGLVARGYRSDHKELAFQMFPESSTWRADIVRVEADGDRVPVADDWMGYRWSDLVDGRGLDRPEVRRHADAGLDNQLAFLDAALDWAAAHTPRDDRTLYLEAAVTVWHNTEPPEVVVLRSRDRDVAP